MSRYKTQGEESVSQAQAIIYAIQGSMLLLVFVVLSLLDIRVFDIWVGFSFLPLIGIYFWPTMASKSWSFVFLFIAGLLRDIGSDGVLGMWAVLYVFLYLIMGSGISRSIKLNQAFYGFVVFTIVAILGLLFIGRLALGVWPPLLGLTLEAGIAIVLFPFLFWLRRLYLRISFDIQVGLD